jgi:hypothetical protein
MKLLIAILTLCASVAASGSYTSGSPISSAANCSSSSGTTCAITITATTAGDMGYFCASVGITADLPTTLPTTGGSNWIALAEDSSHGVARCYFNWNLTGGVTSISVAVVSTEGRGAVWYEAHSNFTNVDWRLDNSGITYNATSSTSQLGAALTLTGSNDMLMQSCQKLCTSISTPYGTSVTSGSGEAVLAGVLNSTAGQTPNCSTPVTCWTLGASLPMNGTGAGVYEARKVHRVN